MKRCYSCLQEKELTEFRKQKSCRDGLQPWCKQCKAVKDKETRERNGTAISDRKRIWRQKNIERLTENRKAYYAENKAALLARNADYMASNIKIAHAHRIFHQAIKSGKVIRQPCFVCGYEKVEGHHPNYDAPLDVVWLCRMHHRQAHALVWSTQ